MKGIHLEARYDAGKGMVNLYRLDSRANGDWVWVGEVWPSVIERAGVKILPHETVRVQLTIAKETP